MTLGQDLTGVICWTRDYLMDVAPNSEFQAVVGLSGGVDSAVVAAICAKAVGPDKVLGVCLPCKGAEADLEDAKDLAKHLGITTHIIPLRETFQTWQSTWQRSLLANAEKPLVAANAQARLRMLTLYAEANQYGALVVGTTNASEAAVGYATKYGDGGVDIEPIYKFYKTEVWVLAHLLKLPQAIIDRVPTAGLWEGQTDEGELGMSYTELDDILRNFPCDPDKRNRVVNMIRANAHKDMHLPHYRRQN